MKLCSSSGTSQSAQTGEGAEVRGARLEVRLAVHLDERAHAATSVDVAVHEALVGFAPGLLCHARQPALLQQLLGGRLVVTRVLQGAFAVHDSRPGAFPELSDLFGGCHRRLLLFYECRTSLAGWVRSRRQGEGPEAPTPN